MLYTGPRLKFGALGKAYLEILRISADINEGNFLKVDFAY